MACAAQALTHYQTDPERPPGADLPPRLVAANYTHRFAACDTSRFYPNATRNEV